jgi:GNAT superfamily N-acetyltransferase
VNVRLRSLVVADASWADAWLPDVAGSVGHDARDVASLLARGKKERGLLARAIERERDPIGVALARSAWAKPGAGIIELVALPPEHARRGYGTRAAALIELELRDAGSTRVYVPAPAVHGIAMYFWIRLGYHPLMRDAWPCQRDNVAWMVRQLSA